MSHILDITHVKIIYFIRLECLVQNEYHFLEKCLI